MATRIKKSLLATVERLTLSGMRQNEIAKKLGVHRNSVLRYQRRLNLPAWRPTTPAEEREILRLLLSGRGTSSIGKHLGCGEYRVREVARKFEIKRGRGHSGFRWKPDARAYLRLMDLCLQHKHSCKQIAKIIDAPYRTTVRLAHKILSCETFLGGTDGRLDSYMPMKHAAAPLKTQMTDEERAVKIASRLTEIFAAELPKDHFCRAVIFAGLCFRTIDESLLLSLTEAQQIALADRCVGSMVQAIAILNSASQQVVH